MCTAANTSAATKQVDAYQTEIAVLARFEWTPNGATRPDGSRQYLAPHRGGCEHCLDEHGQPRLNADGWPRTPCCQAASRGSHATFSHARQALQGGDDPDRRYDPFGPVPPA